MIDRLEELLEQVEEPEDGQEAALPGRLGPVLGFSEAKGLVGAEAEQTLLTSLPGREEMGELQGRQTAGGAEPPLMRELAYAGAGSALPDLYRQLARAAGSEGAVRSASVAVVRETVPSAAAGLTAGELDLAMRRDSRRYDGGMTIY